MHLLRRAVRLALPVLVPSWRFFDSVGPSPRIEFQVWPEASRDVAQVPGVDELPWTPWILTPETVGVGAMCSRLLFNAARNEVLYLLACCERVVDEASSHAERQIVTRLAVQVREARRAAHASDPSGTASERMCFRFRIVEVFRDGEALQRQVAFESSVRVFDALGLLA